MNAPFPTIDIEAYKHPVSRRQAIDERLEELAADPAVQEVKRLLREKLYYGSTCPTCTQNVQMHKHSVRRVLLAFAALMYKEYGHGPWKLDEEQRRVYEDYPFEPTGVEMLREVGIIEGATKVYSCEKWECGDEGEHPDGHPWSRGVYAITEYGAALLSDAGEFPEALYYYNRKPFGQTMTTVSYSTALDEVGYASRTDEPDDGSAA